MNLTPVAQTDFAASLRRGVPACLILLFLLGFAMIPATSVWAQPTTIKEQTLVGTKIAYSITTPLESLAVHRDTPGYDLTFSLGVRLNFGILAQRTPLPDLKTFVDARKQVLLRRYSNLKIIEDKTVSMAGRDWHQLQFSGQVEGDTILLIYHYYTGDEGTYELAASSYVQDALKNRAEMIAILSSFKFPAASVTTTPSASGAISTNASPPAGKAP